MAGEIATAFVRIRPNMTGFKSETESGVKSAFSGIAKIAGVAFGAAEAFRFGKDIVGDAATLQKSIEVVNAEFGKGAEAIHKFADNAGIGLGIASHATEGTAARFGILFQNLGIGKDQAAAMTVGLLKLAGSLSAIRGVDPSSVLDRLPLAVAGNLRSLKQLGVAIDAQQIKYAALKLGLISSVKDAITPAIRAQAIYALATANLGKFQEQARKHAGDLVNVQRRLSAEWDRAKEQLGTALLPIITKYARELEKWLSTMLKSGRLQRDFNTYVQHTVRVVRLVASTISTAWSVFKTVTGWVGGTKSALVALFAVIAIQKIRAIAGAIVSQLVNNGFRQLRIATEEEKAAYLEAFGTMEVATVGLGATIKSALITTGIGAIIVAVGLLVGYIFTHWDKVKKYTVALADGIAATWGGLKTLLLGVAESIGGAMAYWLLFPLRVFVYGVQGISDLLDAVGVHVLDFSNRVGKMLDSFGADLVTKGVGNIKKGAAEIANGFGKGWSDALRKQQTDPTTKTTIKKMGETAGTTISNGIVLSVSKVPSLITKAMADATRQAIQEANKRIVASVISAEKNLDSIGQKLAARVNQILSKLGMLDGAIAGSPGAIAFKKLRDLIAAGAPEFKIARTSQELSTDLSTVAKTSLQTQKEKIKAQFAELTREFNKGQISLATFNKRVADLLAKNHISYKNAGKVLGKAFADGFMENLKALKEQAAAIAATPSKFRREARASSDGGEFRIIRPLEVMRRENERIALRAERQRERIAKATEKTAASTAKTAQQLANVHVASLPGSGKASKNARKAAGAGVQP